MKSFQSSFSGLIDIVGAIRQRDIEEISELTETSARHLAPLGEPLACNFGLNRWLARASEEAYSDWLGWAFSRMTVSELTTILGIPNNHDTNMLGRAIRIEREVKVSKGHQGRQGRLDLLITIDPHILIVIEVKLTPAEEADTKKQNGYVQSIEESNEFCSFRKHYILLSKSANKSVIDGFRTHTYSVLCRNMRRLAIGWQKEDGKLLDAAMLLAVTASFETNILGLSLDKNALSPELISHFKLFINGTQYE